MGVERFVHIRSQGLQLREPVPRHARQIVMLVVISDVEREPIKGAIVAIGLLAVSDDEMFLYPARAERMQPDAEHHAGGEEKERPWPEDREDHAVEGEAEHDVCPYPRREKRN